MTEQSFNPATHLRSVQGSAYLPASARKLWFVEQNAHYSIVTDAHTISERIAVFKATVTIFSGDYSGAVARSATGWGSETPGDFGDYIEKAETKALSRAFDNLGYGTAAALDDDDVISDAPIAAQTNVRQFNNAAPRNGGGNNNGNPSAAQINYLNRLCEERRIDPEAHFGKLPELMTRSEISTAIDSLTGNRRA